jgi:hypothetical protein
MLVFHPFKCYQKKILDFVFRANVSLGSIGCACQRRDINTCDFHLLLISMQKKLGCSWQAIVDAYKDDAGNPQDGFKVFL